jgi:hypothetical protein
VTYGRSVVSSTNKNVCQEKVLSDPTEMYFFVFAIFQLAFENNCKFAVCFDLVWILEINCWLLNFIIIG